MKVNVIGMILNNAGRRSFEGAVLDDAGKPMSAADSLHTLMMEYAKAFNGGDSKLAALSREVSIAAQAPAADVVDKCIEALAAHRDTLPFGEVRSAFNAAIDRLNVAASKGARAAKSPSPGSVEGGKP